VAYTQDNSLIAVNTPLGKDVLLLTGFNGTEGLSRPFDFELDMLSENPNIPFADIIGKNVTISILLPDGGKRFFNGIISRFSQGRAGGEGGGDPRLSHYRAEMVPWLWLLTQTADSRIFQGLAVPDIVEKIFKEKAFSDFKMLLNGNYHKRDYCVQYRETDFNFVSRLLEEEGICYFFEHEEKMHTLVLADAPEKHKPCPKQGSARYQTTSGGWLEEDVITSLEKVQEIRPGKYTLNDFNFETPTTNLKVDVPSKIKLGPGEREVYDYPGLYAKKAEGSQFANVRMEEEEAKITTIIGSSVCRDFTSGYRFKLLGHYRQDMDEKEFVLASLSHGATHLGYTTKSSLDVEGFSYSNNFTCIPFDVPYRPPRNTPKPEVRGTQTAIVVGPAGEEIYPDKYGRVKVQFHWDREGKRDENSSCWIRVAQLWSGPGWGAMYIPRIGQEVVVDFLEGDPDRPIIIGCVYHGNNMPPYPLPDDKTRSVIKSDSSLGSGGSNEIRFEDKKGKEEIYLHGQKDWTIAIVNDKNQTVGQDESLRVARNKTIQVGANHTESIGANMSLTVGSNKTETIGVASAETIGAAKALTVGAAYQVSVGAAMNETVGAAKGEEIGGAKIVLVGAHSRENVAKDKVVDAGGNLSESAGKNVSMEAGNTMDLHSGDDFTIRGQKKGVIEIADQLTIQCGSASITLKKNGDISIEGKKINLKGSGDIIMKGSKIKEN